MPCASGSPSNTQGRPPRHRKVYSGTWACPLYSALPLTPVKINAHKVSFKVPWQIPATVAARLRGTERLE